MATKKDKIRAAAQKYLQKGQLDKAIREFRRLVDEDPRDVRTLLKIGDLQTRKGDHKEATETYSQVAGFFSDQGFFLKAVAVYKQILKLDPNLIPIGLKLAALYRQLGLVSDAINQFRQISQLYEQNGQIEESLDILRQMVELDPDNVASRIKLAELYAGQGMAEEARSGFQEAATYLREQSRIEDYIKVAERLVHFDSSDFDTARQLAQVYLDRNEARRALAKLQLCFRANPKNIDTLELLGVAFNALGQKQKMLSVYREVLRIHRSAGRDDRAVETAQKIIAIDPDDAAAKQTLDSNPASKSNLARIQPVQRAPQEIQEVSSEQEDERHAEEDAEITAEQLLVQVDLYLLKGWKDKALLRLERVADLEQEHPELPQKLQSLSDDEDPNVALKANLLLGRCLSHHTPDQAQKHLERVLELEPDHKVAQELLLSLGGGAPQDAETEDDLGVDIEVDIDLGEPSSADAEAETNPQEVAPSPPPEGLEVDVELEDDLVVDARTGSVEEIQETPPMEEAEVKDPEGEELAAQPLPEPQEKTETTDLEEPEEGEELAAQPLPEPQEKTETTDLEEPEEGEELAAQPLPEPQEKAETTDLGAGSQEPSVKDPLDALAAEADALQAEAFHSTPESNDVLPETPTFAAEAEQAPKTGSERAKRIQDLAGLEDIDALISGAVPSKVDKEEGPKTEAQKEQVLEAAEVGGSVEQQEPSELEEATELQVSMEAREVTERVEAANLQGKAETQEVEELQERTESVAPVDDLSTEIGEINFFVQQGLMDDALEQLEQLLQQHPTHPELLELGKALLNGMPEQESDYDPAAASAQLEAQAQPEALAESIDRPSHFDDDLDNDVDEFSLELGDIEEELGDGLLPEDSSDSEFELGFNDVFEQFKKGVADQVEESDHETHYNLGIAYREMGLVEDAIREFSLAKSAPQSLVGAVTMIGICYLELGRGDEAIKNFGEGLQSKWVKPAEVIALRYEIGRACEMMERWGDALRFYEKVHEQNPSFRDVSDRYTSAQVEAGTSNSETSADLEGLLQDPVSPTESPRSNKISYV